MAPVYGGTLKILGQTSPDNIGNHTIGIPSFNPFVPFPAIEPLMWADEHGNPIPWMLEGWEIDKDNLTFTMYLKQGIRFHDGTPLNAEAVIWNAQTLMDNQPVELLNVASFEALDEYTVRINMSQWDVLMEANFMLKPGNMISPTAVQENGAEWALTNPVCTGPFKFVSLEKDVSLKYTRNDDYWQEGKPYLDAIEWIFVSDVMTRVASFKAGEAHVVTGLTAVQANDLAQTGDYIITTAPTQIFSLYPDSVNEDSPWYKVEVRKAAAYAINREELCEAFGYGFYEPTDQIGYPGYPAYNTDIEGYPYNPDLARQMLEDAGYPDGFDTTIWYVSGGDDSIYLAVQGYWEEVGINATLEVVQQNKLVEISSTGWENGLVPFLPPFVAVGYPVAKNLTFHLSQTSPFTVSVWHPDEIEELLDESNAADTYADSNEICKEINRLIIDEYCTLFPLFVSPSIVAKVKYLHDDQIMEIWQDKWNPAGAWLEHE
jgi:ABC-type transport system substrate-binding protein